MRSTAGADHPVAGHDHRQRVAGVGRPDGPDGGRPTDRGGDLAVGAGLPGGDHAELLPDGLLEVSALGPGGQGELDALAGDQGDTLIGGQGVDRIFGVGGDDDIEQNLVFVSGASDEAHGGPGRDCIDGGGGVSRQFGDQGDDNIPCEFTAFVDPQAALTSGPGPDIVHGGTGNDSMDGIFDSDTVYGDAGNDLINDPYPNDQDKEYGGPGDDVLNASDLGNDDLVDGGPGNDTCIGDPGDTFVNC